MPDRDANPLAAFVLPVAARAIPLAALTFLLGCGLDPHAGGGTELPGPIRVYVMADPLQDQSPSQNTTLVAARQWRLWGLGSRSVDSTTLESRGLLADSSGIVTLPPDSGTYLVEAWTKTDPPDSVDLRMKIANSDLPTSNCLNVLRAGSTPNSIHGCTQVRNASPSAISHFGSANLPDVLTMVRIPGNPSHQFRILGVVEDTLPMGEARLWKWNGTSLIFRGLLKHTGATTTELPTLSTNDSFVVEAWRNPGEGSLRIPTISTMSHSQMDSLSACKTAYTDPLPGTLTLHQCGLATANPSGGAIAPNFSAVMEYIRGE